jgi:hypothetical protein
MLCALTVAAVAQEATAGRAPARQAPPATTLPALDALVRRIEAMATGVDGRAAAQALDRARWAVVRARAWLGRGDVNAAQRSMQSAEAAVAWAERQVALVRTRADHAAALAAAEQAEREAAQVRQAHERAQARLQEDAQ